MTNTKLLEKVIEDSGMKKKAIAKRLGLTPYGFQRKVDSKSEFKASEISLLCSLLGIDSQLMVSIFFKDNSEFDSLK